MDSIRIIEQPDIEKVRSFIRDECGDKAQHVYVHGSGVYFGVDKNKGVFVDVFDQDTVSDYISSFDKGE